MTTRTMHATELITAEIEGRLGFFPSFFGPALAVPDVLEQLWRQTLAAYLDNPLPAVFKERLFAYVSRLRSCEYCVVTHSCELRELGATGREVFELLEPLLGDDPSRAAHLLRGGRPLRRWPAPGSADEAHVIALAAHAFVDDDVAEPCRAELRALLGPRDYAHLVVLLAYITTCHDWLLAHPEISCRDDERVSRHLLALVREEPRLREVFDGRARTSAPARRDHLAAIVDGAGNAIAGERRLGERYLQTVHQATGVLAQFGPVDEMLPAVLRVVGEGMGWAVGSVWMPTRRHGVLQLRCAELWHVPALDGAAFEAASRKLRLAGGEDLPGRVWETGRARWVADVADEPHSRRADEARRDGLRTGCLLPVRGHDGVVAVLELLSREVRAPDPVLLEMLDRIAGQVGEYLERKGACAPLAGAAADVGAGAG